jgi:hypothetical protein
MSEHNELKLPPDAQFRRMSRRKLRKLMHDFIESAERGDADKTGSGVQLAILRAQYVRDELARRAQSRQTGWISRMTFVITVMTAVIMIATVCPEWVQSAAHRLLDIVQERLQN